MDLVITFLSVLVGILLLHILQIITYRAKKLPPGPTPLPVIGSLHLIGKLPHTNMAEIAKTYGPIMSLKLGQVTTIVLSSPSMAKELLQKQDATFANRTNADALRALDHDKYGMAFMPPEARWRGLRKVSFTNVFSAKSLDRAGDFRREKVAELVAYCKKRCEAGEAVNIGKATFLTSLNLLSTMFFSRDLTSLDGSGSAEDYQSVITNIVIACGTPNVSDFFPIIRGLDVQGTRRKATFYMQKLFDLFRRLIDEKLEKKHRDTNDVLDTLIDICENSPQDLDRNHLEHLLLGLMIGGTDTTSSIVEWAMAHMLQNPHTLKKARDELEEVVGKDKTVDEAHLASLPYLQCVFKETLRLHPQAPFLIPRRAMQDEQLGGYTIPKDSQVLCNVWAIARDPSIWESPEEFKPERFLNSELDVRGRDFELLPFGAGRRTCPGMPLAMRAIPLILASLLHSFDWKIDGGIKPEDLNMEEELGITLVKAKPLLAVPIA